MKKTLLLLITLGSVIFQLSAQEADDNVDDATVGSGLNHFNYVGAGWVHATNTTDPYYGNTVSYSNQTGNSVTINFFGNKAELYSAKASNHGIMAVSVDNGPETMVDLYSSDRVSYFKAYTTSPTMQEGPHVMKIRVTGTKNALSSNRYAIIDGLDISSHGNASVGLLALKSVTTGTRNTAVGMEALTENTVGNGNIAVGFRSLYSNIGTGSSPANDIPGNSNLAVGNYALFLNTEGSSNIAVGTAALSSNTSGSSNLAIGYDALRLNETGNSNTAIGFNTLFVNPVGNFNTALGWQAGYLTHGHSNSTAIGNGSTFTASNQMRFGNAQVTSIGGAVSWSTLSDGRVKKDLKEDVSGLSFIEKLRPVSYIVDVNEVNKLLRIPDSLQNKTALKQKPMRQVGFVAQEVDAIVKKTGYVFTGVEAPQNESDPYSIRYAEFVVPLVKAVQELSTTVKDQKNEIEELKLQLQSFDSTLAVGHTGDVAAVLHQNTPNPFSQDTEIKVTVPDDAMAVSVKVYNLEGKQLKTFTVKERGKAKIKISGSELNAGMYLYTLIIDGKAIDTKRMILTE